MDDGAAYAPGMREATQAFVQGINAYVAEVRAGVRPLPPEFKLTASMPDDWQTEDVVRGFTLGGNDYIRKPFSMEELIVRINNVLRVKHSVNEKVNADIIALGRYQFYINRQLFIK